MRRLVAVLVMATLVLALAGCGGKKSAETAQPATTTTTGAAAAPVAVGAAGANTGIGDVLGDRSIDESSTFMIFPTDSFVPSEVASKVAEKTPLVLAFYDSAQPTTDEYLGSITKAMAEKRGLAELIRYDMGKWVETDASGNITVKPEFAGDLKAQQAIQLARALGVRYTPFTVLVDQQGYIIWKARGYADTTLLERQIDRATR